MAKKKSTEGGWEFYHFDPVAMNQVLKDEIKRGKRKK